jgi:hypothetical protein
LTAGWGYVHPNRNVPPIMTTADMVAPTGQARILIALREQTGLTLRAEQGSYEVLRVRRIERPSAN